MAETIGLGVFSIILAICGGVMILGALLGLYFNEDGRKEAKRRRMGSNYKRKRVVAAFHKTKFREDNDD